MREVLNERGIRASTKPEHENDFSFVLNGITYFIEKAVSEEKDFLTAQALRELNAERDKNAALEKKLMQYRIKAAKYDAMVSAMKNQAV